MRKRSHRGRVVPLAVIWAAAALTGCGNVTVGGVGETEVYMSGDASDAAATSRPAPAITGGGEGPASAVAILGTLEGDVSVTAAFSLRRDDGSIEVLTPVSIISVTLDLQGVQEPRVLQRSVPAGSYQAVTVTFTEVTAEVTGGLEVDGVPFLGTVDVDLGGGLDVTESLPFVVEEGQTVAVLVDLNADGWIPLLDALTGTVAGEDFAVAVAIIER